MPATPGYKERIEKLAPGYDPHHIEAFMRDTHGTLDRLSPEMFDREVSIAVVCVEEGGAPFAERLAASFGL